MFKIFAPSLLLVGLLAQQGAYAATTTYDFTNLLQPSSTSTLPAGTITSVGSLTLTDVTGGVEFFLQGDFGWLGSSAKLSQLFFSGPSGTVSNVSGNAFKSASLPTYDSYTSAGFSFTWENEYPVGGSGADLFKATDWSKWTISGAGLDVNDFVGNTMVHINGVNFVEGSSIKVMGVTSPVPEAETYSMMLLGLGFMGFIARRRKNNQA